MNPGCQDAHFPIGDIRKRIKFFSNIEFFASACLGGEQQFVAVSEEFEGLFVADELVFLDDVVSQLLLFFSG